MRIFWHLKDPWLLAYWIILENICKCSIKQHYKYKILVIFAYGSHIGHFCIRRPYSGHFTQFWPFLTKFLPFCMRSWQISTILYEGPLLWGGPENSRNFIHSPHLNYKVALFVIWYYHMFTLVQFYYLIKKRIS